MGWLRKRQTGCGAVDCWVGLMIFGSTQRGKGEVGKGNVICKDGRKMEDSGGWFVRGLPSLYG